MVFARMSLQACTAENAEWLGLLLTSALGVGLNYIQSRFPLAGRA